MGAPSGAPSGALCGGALGGGAGPNMSFGVGGGGGDGPHAARTQPNSRTAGIAFLMRTSLTNASSKRRQTMVSTYVGRKGRLEDHQRPTPMKRVDAAASSPDGDLGWLTMVRYVTKDMGSWTHARAGAKDQ